jgi:hypothetical protein
MLDGDSTEIEILKYFTFFLGGAAALIGLLLLILWSIATKSGKAGEHSWIFLLISFSFILPAIGLGIMKMIKPPTNHTDGWLDTID